MNGTFNDYIALRRVEKSLQQALNLIDDVALKDKMSDQLKALRAEIETLRSLFKKERKAC
jgi:hypothetical protein